MKIIDIHSDIFTDIAFRRENGETKVFERLHLPKLKQGGIAGMIGVFWVEPTFTENERKQRLEKLIYHTFNDLKETTSVRIVTTPETLLQAYNSDEFFIYLGLEGLTFMEEWDGASDEEKISRSIEELDEISIKHAIFAWNEKNFIATGSGCNKQSGLQENGAFTIQQLEKHNWIIDVSHLNDTSFWDIVNTTNTPLLASHNNARSLCQHERNLTDEQLKAIANSGGLIGVNAIGPFVDEQAPTIERFVDHVSYITELVGVEHVAFGFDFVNYLTPHPIGSNMTIFTKGLEDVTKVPDALEEMRKRGFSNTDIEKISFNNFYDYFCKIHTKTNIGGLI